MGGTTGVMLALSLFWLVSPAVSMESASGLDPLAVPGPPKSLNVSMATATTASLVWEPPEEPNGNLTGYTVYYYHWQQDNDRLALSCSCLCVFSPELTHTYYTYTCLSVCEINNRHLSLTVSVLCSVVMVGGETNTLELTGLQPFTTYNVSVTASTAQGEGLPITKQFTTGEAGEWPNGSLSLSLTHAHTHTHSLSFSLFLSGHVQCVYTVACPACVWGGGVYTIVITYVARMVYLTSSATNGALLTAHVSSNPPIFHQHLTLCC